MEVFDDEETDPGVGGSAAELLRLALRERRRRFSRLCALHPLLASLGADQREQLLTEQELVVRPPDAVFLRSGEKTQRSIFVLSGAFQLELPATGAERGFVAAVGVGPALLGEPELLFDRKWAMTGVALTELSFLEVSRDRHRELLMSSGGFAVLSYLELAYRFLSALEAWKRDARATPAQLVARYLLARWEASRQAGADEEPRSLALRIKQGELAVATRLRRETVNRVLKTWVDAGWVSFGRDGLELRDETALLRLLPEDGREQLVQTVDPNVLQRGLSS